MAKHSAPSPVLNRLAVDLVRTIAEHPDYRGLLLASMGPERFARMQTDYQAHDAWENEGGALAHHDL